MKLKLGMLFMVAVFFLSACSTGNALQNANQVVANPAVNNYVERRNIAWKIDVQDRSNTVQWCTFFSQAGSPITTVAVLNKMTSGGKRLTPVQSLDTTYFSFSIPGDPHVYYTSEVPAADGTFGSSTPYEFGFTPEGMDGYFQTNLPYYCSLKPLVWQTPTINLGVDEGLFARQLQAEQALRSGQCVDTQLNVVACPPVSVPPVAPPVIEVPTLTP